MAGGFILVVGPSGAGKDTLIDHARKLLADDASFVFPRRLVTRAPSPHEDHGTIDEAGFVSGEAEGAFALSWRAHGLGYAVPRSALEQAKAGRTVICNVSRTVIDEARQTLPNVAVVEITAPESVLRSRLAQRKRSTDGDLSKRIDRSRTIDPVQADCVIVNDADIATAAERLAAFFTACADRH